ncbi:MAG: lysine 2,3-aminomutase, partial [Myxococcales bacterium]
MTAAGSDAPRYRAFTRRDLNRIPQVAALPLEQRQAMRAVSAVLPFRVNPYVVDELIDWSRVPDDPIFQLTFPQPGMLEEPDFQHMLSMV